MIKFNILEKSIRPRLVAVSVILIGVLFAMGVFYQPLAREVSKPENSTAEKDKSANTDARIIVAMKTSMYDQVADDEDIDIMAAWIKAGAKNDDTFKQDIYPIIKNDCTNCHSKTSTMTRKVPHIPFTSYEGIKKFTKVGPTNAQCLECHANPVLKDPPDKKHKSKFVDQAKFEKSVHKKINCIRCHVVLHPETDKVYQDTEAFKSHVLNEKTAADHDHPEIFKPTCANCHPKVDRKLQKSAHAAQKVKTETAQYKPSTLAAQKNQTEIKLPKCNDCHGTQHYISDTKLNPTKFDVVNRCGACHQQLIKTYFTTYHGKAAKLGSDRVAKCVNCHGFHDLLSPSNPASTLHADNIQKTCQECHPKANKSFTGFLPHADHLDGKKYPQLFYPFWLMTLLLVSTIFAFGVHALLWLNRSLIEKFRTPQSEEKSIVFDKKDEKHVKRFNVSHTVLHVMIIVSFLTLAITGMSLKFPDNFLFAGVTHLVGGPHVMGTLHRIGAWITLIYFAAHLFQLFVLFVRRKITIMGLLTEEYSLIPLPRDLIAVKDNLLYFIGKGPKPEFGRWTYWEKFDYMAVFWGVSIIGITGLTLAFPEFATRFLPGWALNVATIIHSDEALLATGFIFSMHFFHSHMRPDNFPMDTVIFTQRLPLARFKEERPREYQELVENGELEKYLVDPPGKWYSKIVLIMGWLFLSIGIITLGAIIYSLVRLVF
jgi:cytochrome b subunit of formate dehydrogenase